MAALTTVILLATPAVVDPAVLIPEPVAVTKVLEEVPPPLIVILPL